MKIPFEEKGIEIKLYFVNAKKWHLLTLNKVPLFIKAFKYQMVL